MMRSALLSCAILVSVASTAPAQFRSSWDPTSWIAAPTGVITFGGHANGTLLTDQYLASDGVTFENLRINTTSIYFLDPPYATNAIGLHPWTSIIIRFSAPVTAVAFQAIANGGASYFEAFLGVNPIIAVNTLTNVEPGWKGFENRSVDWIRFTAPETTNGLIGIDNLQWYREANDNLEPFDPTVVPEPATLILLATGLAVMGAVHWRRRHARPGAVPQP